MRAPERAPTPDELIAGARRLLEQGEIQVRGRMPWASNATLLVDVALAGDSARAIYKPGRGERPLWDYPAGLYRREVAVAVIDGLLGWDLVPPTVQRDGPFGPGSVQLFVPSVDDEHYFTLVERPEHHGSLRAICAFDLLVNNGDRKGGHCLLGLDGRVRAIDHGLCLHADPKLRTVVWDFAGQPVPAPLLADVERVFASDEPLPSPLDELLDDTERSALVRRARALVDHPAFPPLRSARSFPWPLV